MCGMSTTKKHTRIVDRLIVGRLTLILSISHQCIYFVTNCIYVIIMSCEDMHMALVRVRDGFISDLVSMWGVCFGVREHQITCPY